MRYVDDDVIESCGASNGFAITVLVVSIVAIIVCILIVFLVKPCTRKTHHHHHVDVNPEGAGAAAASSEGLIEPDDAAGLQAATASGHSIVMHHAKWCGHCKAALPEFTKAATDMARACPGAKIIAMDGDKLGPEGLKAHGVQGFPTIKHMIDGRPMKEYQGNRKAQSFVDFAKSCKDGATGAGVALQDGDVAMADPSLPHVHIHEPTSAAELDRLLASGDSMVMFHAKWCGHCKNTLPEYKKAAQDMMAAHPGLKVIAVNGDGAPDILKAHGVKGFPTIKHIRNGTAVEYAGDRTSRSFVEFAKKQAA
jgi:thiol-disulfide isomerase/thioredoxin